MSVEAYLAGVDPASRPALDALRAVAAAAHPGLVEEIKWNAPSFSFAGQDRVTLGLERKGGLRLVLHRGAAVQETSDFRFTDDSGLARWLAPDRGVVQLADAAEVARCADALQGLIRRWIEANG